MSILYSAVAIDFKKTDNVNRIFPTDCAGSSEIGTNFLRIIDRSLDMNILLERHINEIRESILMMASLADRNFRGSLRALESRDPDLTRSIEADDSEIDLLEITVDEMVISCIATQRPVARDCRFMIVASKMAGSLERIGDQATTIARRVRGICAEPPLPNIEGWAEMAIMAQGMLNDAISALIQERWDSAQEVISRDSRVDEYHRKVAAQLSDYMARCPTMGNRVVDYLAIAKSIERVADHAKHISELVYFLYCGKDIRHALVSQGWFRGQAAEGNAA